MKNEIQYGPHLFPGVVESYIKTNNGNKLEAHIGIINSIAESFGTDKTNSLIDRIKASNENNIQISFMNYGDTELVYLLKINDNEKYAMLINQPHTKKETVKNQFNNLKRFYDNDPRFIIKPFESFENDKHFIYLTEYVNNAICIGNMEKNILGIWNPLPHYHFEELDKKTSDKINISRIAHLINAYDEKNELGPSKTQISGNDFMLTQKTDFSSLRSIIDNTKIIAVRSTENIPLNEYINLIKNEFQIATNRNDNNIKSGKIKINHHSKMPIGKDIIEEGIKNGILLKKSNS